MQITKGKRFEPLSQRRCKRWHGSAVRPWISPSLCGQLKKYNILDLILDLTLHRVLIKSMGDFTEQKTVTGRMKTCFNRSIINFNTFLTVH